VGSYLQLIEVASERVDDFLRLHDEWLAATEGQRTATQVWICRDRDRPATFFVMVEFPSPEAAAVNNDLPATATIAAGMAALADSPPVFRNLDLLRHDLA
jgi:quinol monooxygenase YgiN